MKTIAPSDFRLLFIGATSLACRACERPLKSGIGFIATEAGADARAAFGPVCVQKIDDRAAAMVPNLAPKFAVAVHVIESKGMINRKPEIVAEFQTLKRKPAGDFAHAQVRAAEFVLLRHELNRRGFRYIKHNPALEDYAQKIMKEGPHSLGESDLAHLREIYKAIHRGWGTRDATHERAKLCLMVDEEIISVRKAFRANTHAFGKLNSIQDQLHRKYSLSKAQIAVIIGASGHTGIPSRLPTSLDIADPYRRAPAPQAA